MGKIDGIIVTALKRITHPKGDILHGMKQSDAGFAGFGEAYFSNVLHDDVKAWKRHNLMTLNLIVPVGSVKFVFIDTREKSISKGESFEIVLSKDNYKRLTVPPGIWFGFKGMGDNLNLILNIADLEHHPDEVDRKEIEEIEYNW